MTNELRVQTRPDYAVIDLSTDVFASVDKSGMRVQMDNGGIMVEVCEMNWAQAVNFAEFIQTGKRTFA